MVIQFLLFFFCVSLSAAQLEKPFLKLESVIEGELPLYPGQQITVGYRYLFNTNIDLADELLPLLNAQGFKKLGDKVIQEKQEKGLSIRQVTQKMKAIDPGEYVFDLSRVVGYMYRSDQYGRKQYLQPPLKSEIPRLKLTILPFPIEGKPASFQGALGDFNFQVKLLTSPTMHVGDKLQLSMQVEGQGEFDTVTPPNLCCQPGFSGFFQTSDLPPVTELKEKTKSFLIDLYLENRDASMLPAIEFSFFNPKIKQYVKKSSVEIPLQIEADSTAPLPTYKQLSAATPEPFTFTWTLPSYRALHVAYLPLIIFALGLLVVLSQYPIEAKRQGNFPALSQQLYKAALHVQHDEKSFYALMQQALEQAIQEEIPGAQLLLQKIEQARFGQGTNITVKEVVTESEQIFNTRRSA